MSAPHLLESKNKPNGSADSRPQERVHFHLHLHDRDRSRGRCHPRALDHEAKVTGHGWQDAECQGHDGKSNRRPTLDGHDVATYAGTEGDVATAQGVARGVSATAHRKSRKEPGTETSKTPGVPISLAPARNM